MNERLLLDRLDRLCRRIRFLLVVDGVGQTTAGILGGVVLSVAVDYMVVLPSVARLLLASAMGVTLVVALWRRVLRPMITPIERGEIAALLDRRFGELEDRLASAVGFLASPPPGSLLMVRRVVGQATEAAGRLPMESILRPRRSLLTASAAVILCLALTGLAWAAPWWLKTGARRYLMPFTPTEWPRRVHIEPITGDAKRPIGEWFEVRARVLRGQTPSLRVHVVTEGPGGLRDRHPMTYDTKADEYAHAFNAIQQGFDYWFEAGDDSTADRGGRFRVNVLPRPVVLQADIELYDPPYVTGSSSRRCVLEESPVTAVEGSKARLTVRISKTVARDPEGRPLVNLALPDGSNLFMDPIDASRRRFAAVFDVQRSGTLTVRVVDEDGFDNRGGTPYGLTVRQDELPHVVVVEPQAVVEATPSAAVGVSISADDDFGLRTLTLRAVVDRIGSDRPTVFDLTDRLRPSRVGGRCVAAVEWVWELDPMRLQAGDVVTYRASVTDNYDLSGRRHSPVESAEMRIKVISPDQFADRVREDLRVLNEAVRQVLSVQEAVRDQTEVLLGELERNRRLTDADGEASVLAASRQTQLAGRTSHLAGRFRQLVQRLQANRSPDTDVHQRSTEASKILSGLAAGPMVQAAENLQQAGQAKAPDHRYKALVAAKTLQQTVADRLRSLLAGMERSGDFQDIVRHTQYLLDQQQAQTESTHRLSQRTLGRRLEELPAPLIAELKQQARQQRHLAEEQLRLNQNMVRLAEALRTSDPTAAAALDDARTIAEVGRLQHRLSDAADAVADNRMAQAQDRQRAAEDLLHQMIAALERRRSQELETLNKQLHDAAEKVRAILDEQRALHDQTRQTAAGDASRREQLAQRQEGLSRSTGAVADEVGKLDRADRPARDLRRATGQMHRAAGHLRQGQADRAVSEQGEVLRQLQDALEELRKLRAQSEVEMAARTLLAVAEEIKKLRDEQQQINEQLDGLVRAASEGQDLSRADLRRLDKMAERERQVAAALEIVRGRLGDAPVYDWVMRRVGADMGRLAGRFDQRLVDGTSQAEARRILERLDHLRMGLEQRPPDTQDATFADGGGGGRGGGSGKTKAVPTAAELVVLRSMQSDLNRRTQELDLKIGQADRPSEAQLEQVRQLGRLQEQIRNLAEEVYRRAAQ